MPVKYYYDLMSQPCRAIYIFLKMSNIPFESKLIAVRKGEQRKPEYLALNPLGKVPVIEDNGFVLTESVAIIKYLSDKYALSDSWYPKSLQKRAKIDEYCAWQHLNTRMKSAKLFLSEFIMKAPPSKVQHLLDDMNMMLDEFESVYLKDRKFVTGDDISIADLFAVCEIIQVTASGRDPCVGRPALKAWMERVRSVTNPHFDEAHYVIHRLGEKMRKQKL